MYEIPIVLLLPSPHQYHSPHQNRSQMFHLLPSDFHMSGGGTYKWIWSHSPYMESHLVHISACTGMLQYSISTCPCIQSKSRPPSALLIHPWPSGSGMSGIGSNAPATLRLGNLHAVCAAWDCPRMGGVCWNQLLLSSKETFQYGECSFCMFLKKQHTCDTWTPAVCLLAIDPRSRMFQAAQMHQLLLRPFSVVSEGLSSLGQQRHLQCHSL